MKLLLSFLRARRMALLPPLFAGIFALVLCAFRLPLYALLYALILCLPPYWLALAVSFHRYRARHRLLERLLQAPGVCAGQLPPPIDALDADMQALLRSAIAERDTALASEKAQYDERIAYYTLWAHQIKTPIAAMRLMLDGQDDAEARRLLIELTRIERYVSMALCYLRLDSTQTDYVFAPCPLEPLVRACVRKFAPQFIQKRIHLAVDPLPGDVLTDEKWLAFVIEQLLSNAVKYTLPGGRVHIGLAPEQTLFIEDTGIGIAPEDLPRIFEQGFTGRNGRADKRASGIGLTLCQRICKNLGHGIRCQSEPGRGTRMELRLASRRLKRE